MSRGEFVESVHLLLPDHMATVMKLALSSE